MNRFAKWISAMFVILYAVAGELLFVMAYKTGVTAHKLILALAVGAFLYLMGTLTEKRATAFAVQAGCCCLVSVLMMSQLVYFGIFGTTYVIASFGGAGDAFTQFFDMVVDAVLRKWVWLAVYGVQLIILFTAYRRRFLNSERDENQPKKAAAGFLGITVFALSICVTEVSGASSPGYLIRYAFIPENSVKTLGIMPTMLLDFKCSVLGVRNKYDDTQIDMEDVVIEHAAPLALDGRNARATDAQILGFNIMDISFPREERNEELRRMNEYFSSVQPTEKNEYTGMFAGHNLILITAEGFSGAVIDPEITPTLYRMWTEGFRFNNFYTPIWGVSTSDGEFVATTGLLPKAGEWSYTKIAENHMPFGLGNQFKALGYKTMAFHDHSYEYYNRHLSYPVMGYEYYGRGNGLEMTDQWPESDSEMMDLTVPLYVDSDSFHVYYMTVSGHMNYSFTGNMMSYMHRSEVEHLPYSENVKAYVACQLELEKALSNLVTQLREAGVLDKTVIAISADHYPYGLTNNEYAELRGLDDMDNTFELYENEFILWCASMEEPVVIDKCCSSLDIAPTLSNLFGLEYDSRLYIGKDILSDAPGLVMFQNRSFITDRLMYRASGSKVTLFDDSLKDDELEEYLRKCISEVNNLFNCSAGIIENDYYGYLFQN